MVSCPCDRLDVIANETAEAFIEAYKECQEIICSHMEDEPVSNTDKLDNGWIPVGETEGDRMMDEIQRTELIESHIEECKHRISVMGGWEMVYGGGNYDGGGHMLHKSLLAQTPPRWRRWIARRLALETIAKI